MFKPCIVRTSNAKKDHADDDEHDSELYRYGRDAALRSCAIDPREHRERVDERSGKDPERVEIRVDCG
jgi:hypothetical protein